MEQLEIFMKSIFLFLIIFTSSFCFADFSNEESDKSLEMIQKIINKSHRKLSPQELVVLHFDLDDDQIESLLQECQKNPEDCYNEFRKFFKSP